MGINFSGYFFTDPVPISIWQAPESSGLYVISVSDLSSQPLPYRPLYFGETENFATRGIGRSHEKYCCWIREASMEANLYISLFFMPSSRAARRRAIEQQLIQAYRPSCN